LIGDGVLEIDQLGVVGAEDELEALEVEGGGARSG